MSNPSEMYDRAVLIAEANGFEFVDLFLYYKNDGNARFGLKIQPWLNHAVSIQAKQDDAPMDESEQIILSPIDRALLEPIIKAFAFAAQIQGDRATSKDICIGTAKDWAGRHLPLVLKDVHLNSTGEHILDSRKPD